MIRFVPEQFDPVDEEGADAQRQQEQRGCGRLEAREAEVEPARRALDVLPERQHGREEEDGGGVQEPLEPAVEIVVEQ